MTDIEQRDDAREPAPVHFEPGPRPPVMHEVRGDVLERVDCGPRTFVLARESRGRPGNPAAKRDYCSVYVETHDQAGVATSRRFITSTTAPACKRLAAALIRAAADQLDPAAAGSGTPPPSVVQELRGEMAERVEFGDRAIVLTREQREPSGTRAHANCSVYLETLRGGTVTSRHFVLTMRLGAALRVADALRRTARGAFEKTATAVLAAHLLAEPITCADGETVELHRPRSTETPARVQAALTLRWARPDGSMGQRQVGMRLHAMHALAAALYEVIGRLGNQPPEDEAEAPSPTIIRAPYGNRRAAP
jgi:hypothetical protein